MSLASLVDKPLIQNPLAGGGQLGGLTFRQEGDMGRYVADNDPGGIAAGFSNLQDYLAAGNKLPQPTEGVSQDIFGKPNILNMNVTPPSIPVSEQTPLPGIIDPSRDAQRKADEEFLKTADEYQRGFRESEFYKPFAPMTADVAEFIYSSPTKGDITMKGSSSGIGQFGSYLESIGKGNLLKRAGGVGLQQAGPLQPSPPSLFPIKNEKGEDIGGIENTAIATNPIQTGGLGDQGLMDRLTSLEQGIGSLQNQIASLFQMGQASDPFGLGGFMNTRRY
tara:strand:- start:22 stop:855 length:834 start_codon:yes stop_codon:yes gene_type:complete